MAIDTLYADHNQLLAWFLRARAGDAAIYAKGGKPDESHPVCRQVVEWCASGAVEVEQTRQSDGTVFVVRLAPPFELQSPSSDLDNVDRQVLAVIRDRISTDGAAPSLTEIAAACGLRNRQAARYRVRKLEERGMLKRQGVGPDRGLSVLDST